MELTESIKKWAQQTPTAEALRWLPYAVLSGAEERTSCQHWTYAEVVQQASTIAKNLQTLLKHHPNIDSQKTVRIGVALDVCPLLPIVELAIELASCSFVPISLEWPDSRWKGILFDANCSIVVTESVDVKKIVQNEISQLTCTAALSVLVVCTDEIVSTDNKTCSHFIFDNEVVSNDPHREAHVFFTSGSMGKPKGCRVTASALERYCLGKNHACDVDSSATVFIASPATFDPSRGDIFASWMAGATVVMAPPHATYSNLGICLEVSQATHILTTPSLLEQCDIELRTLKQLRVVCIGGEVGSSDLIRKWSKPPRIRLLNFYGTTECCVYQLVNKIYDELFAGDSPRSMRRPLDPNIVLLGLHEDKLKHINEISGTFELVLSGLPSGLGYINEASNSCGTFFRDKAYGHCYRTGDFFKRAKEPCDGSQLHCQIIFRGRRDGQIKINGRRIECSEIENAILSVFQGVLLKVCIFPFDKTIHAICEVHNAPNDKNLCLVWGSALRYLCQPVLSRYMIPAAFHFQNSFPVTANGKTDRRQLLRGLRKKLELQSVKLHTAENSCTSCASITHIEKVTRECWAEVLGLSINEISILSDFRSLSGDSLVALQICKSIHKRVSQSSYKIAISQGERESVSPGMFGEMLGPFSPVHLLRYPILKDYAMYLESEIDSSEADSALKSDVIAKPISTSEGRRITLNTVQLGEERLLNQLLLQRQSEVTMAELNDLLFTSITAGNASCVSALLAAGASVNAKGPSSSTVLHAAARCGNVDVLDTLLRAGASLTGIDAHGQTVLHHAARGGAGSRTMNKIFEACESLKRKLPQRISTHSKAMCMATDIWGRTPLHWAVTNGHITTVSILLEAWSNPNVKDSQGETPLNIAERRAQCRAGDRPDGLRPSTFGSIAKILGGSGKTVKLSKIT